MIGLAGVRLKLKAMTTDRPTDSLMVDGQQKPTGVSWLAHKWGNIREKNEPTGEADGIFGHRHMAINKANLSRDGNGKVKKL